MGIVNENILRDATATYMRGGYQLSTLTTLIRNVRMKKVYVETDN